MSTSDISSAPPTVAGELPSKPSVWPKVVGIIFIVFGALGIMQGCFGAISMLMFGAFSKMMPQDQANMMNSITSLQPWIIASAIAAFCIAVLLLVTGIGVVTRKPFGRKTAFGWAITKMVFVLLNAGLTYMTQQAQSQAMQEMMESHPNTAAAMPMFGPLMMWMGVFAIVFMIIWGWALPVFTLIWFSRSKIRGEVASWGEPSQTVVQENISRYGPSVPSD